MTLRNWPAPPPPTSPWTTRAPSTRARSTPSRWPPRTAPAAPCACRSARQGQGQAQAQGHRHGAPAPRCASAERANYDFFLELPEADRTKLKLDVKGSQFLQPLFEYSGACAGCGETPYVKLLTQLFGDRLIIANATGCSSIYGGNLPTTPYTKNRDGRGPAWSNSLFEDNAEFGLGMRLALDQHALSARAALKGLAGELGDELVGGPAPADQYHEAGIAAQRERVQALQKKLLKLKGAEAARLLGLADYLVRKSVWIVGGDGWAYDIGYGGLDHVLSSGRNVNILVLDTEVYSNTGGQQSKATPLGAAAKFAASGKEVGKKDLGLMAMTYGHVYVARVAFGANDKQTVQASPRGRGLRRPVADHRLQPLHRPRLRHGPGRRAAEAGGGLRPSGRCSATTRAAAPRASRRCSSTRACPRLGARVHAQRDAASAWSRSRPERAKMLMPRPRRRCSSASRSTSSWLRCAVTMPDHAGAAQPAKTSSRAEGRRRTKEEPMDLSPPTWASSWPTRSCRAPRRWSTTSCSFNASPTPALPRS